jgi:ABC-type antimicrobial peptide transport system permease subunit
MLRETLLLLSIGSAVGVLLVLAAGRLTAFMLFGVTPANPGVLVMSVAGMTALALVASWLPADRAAAVDPMQTLREE